MSKTILKRDTTSGWYLDLGTSLFDNFDTGAYDTSIYDEPTIGGKKLSAIIDEIGIAGPWLKKPRVAIRNSKWIKGIVPRQFTESTENLSIYIVDGGKKGNSNLSVDLSVDNQVAIWVNGEFRYAGYSSYGSKKTAHIGPLKAGKNIIQILRGDWWGAAFGDWTFQISTTKTVSTSSIANPSAALQRLYDTKQLEIYGGRSQSPLNSGWSYGYKLKDSPHFIPYEASAWKNPDTRGVDPNGYAGFVAPFWPYEPTINANVNKDKNISLNLWWLPGDNKVIRGNELLLHPGYAGEKSTVRYVAASDGSYRVSATFRDLDPYGGDGAKGSITLTRGNGKGRVLFNKSWVNGGAAVKYSGTLLNLKAGDILDFEVDPNGGYDYDTTSLIANVAKVTYSITPSKTSINEGETLTTTVSTQGLAKGTQLYWQLFRTNPAPNNVTTDDFVNGAFTGSDRINNNGQFTFSHKIKNDHRTEGPESIVLKLATDQAFKNVVAQTDAVVISDTSLDSTSLTTLSYKNKDWQGARYKKLQQNASGNAVVRNVSGSVRFTSKYYNDSKKQMEHRWIAGRPLVVYAHGWQDGPNENDINSSSQRMIKALVDRYGRTHNIALVDWSVLADKTKAPGEYDFQPTNEASVTKQVGETVAEAILATGTTPGDITLIGHSLGSFVMGAAAKRIALKKNGKVGKLIALDPAFGLGYDIDARNGAIYSKNVSPDQPYKFTSALAEVTRAYVASDLMPTGKMAGDNNLAATAQKRYLVQYSKTDFELFDIQDVNTLYHNGVIGVYADLVRKEIEEPDSYYKVLQKFDKYGHPKSDGKFNGVVVATQPWIKRTKTDFKVPKAIGWTDGFKGASIYGSPKDDVMFHDRFDKDSITGEGTRLYAGDGDDWLIGGDPSDNKGVDRFFGGSGSDEFFFGYRRYGERTALPYQDKWSTDAFGKGLDSFVILEDFNRQEDKLNFAFGKSGLNVKKPGDIDRNFFSNFNNKGVGLLYENDDLFAYIPTLSYRNALGFLNSNNTFYNTFADLDKDLYQNV